MIFSRKSFSRKSFSRKQFSKCSFIRMFFCRNVDFFECWFFRMKKLSSSLRMALTILLKTENLWKCSVFLKSFPKTSKLIGINMFSMEKKQSCFQKLICERWTFVVFDLSKILNLFLPKCPFYATSIKNLQK